MKFSYTLFFQLFLLKISCAQNFESIVDSVANRICICLTKDSTINSVEKAQLCMNSLDTNNLKKSLSKTDTVYLNNKLKELGVNNPNATIEDKQGYYFGYLIGKKLIFVCPRFFEILSKEEDNKRK